MLAKIQIRRDTSANWSDIAFNPTLLLGEIGYEIDTNKFKIGDGVHDWNSLPYQLGQWVSDSHGNISYGKNSNESDVLIGKNLIVDGDLSVKGTTTYVNTKEITLEDRMITLNWDSSNPGKYDGTLVSGIEVNAGANWEYNLEDDDPDNNYNTFFGNGVVFSFSYNSTDDETTLELGSNPTRQLTGTLTTSQGDLNITGTETKFKTELVSGSKVQFSDEVLTVASVTSDTAFIATSSSSSEKVGVTALTDYEGLTNLWPSSYNHDKVVLLGVKDSHIAFTLKRYDKDDSGNPRSPKIIVDGDVERLNFNINNSNGSLFAKNHVRVENIGTYDQSADETEIELINPIPNFPQNDPNNVDNYNYQNPDHLKRIYFESGGSFDIKSYEYWDDATTGNRRYKITVVDNANIVKPSTIFQIHNSKKQFYWTNVMVNQGWHLDDDLYVDGIVESKNSWEVTPDFLDLYRSIGSIGIGEQPTSGYVLDVIGDASTNVLFRSLQDVNLKLLSGVDSDGTLGFYNDDLATLKGSIQWDASTETFRINYGSPVNSHLIIDKDGKVGIGTESPSSLLEIAEPTSGASLKVNLKDSESSPFEVVQGSDNYIKVVTSTPEIFFGNKNTNPNITFDTDGDINLNTDVTIENLTVTNTSTLEGTLDVDGATTLKSTLDVTGVSTLSSTLDVTGDLKVNTNKFVVTALSGNTDIAGTLDVDGATTLKSTLDVTGVSTLSSSLDVTGDTTILGKLGIGTTDPQASLEVKNTTTNADIRVNGVNGGLSGVYFGDQADTVRGAIEFDSTENTLALRGYNNEQRLTIDSSGNVGIGTTAPQTTLDIKAEISTIRAESTGSGDTASLGLQTVASGGSGNGYGAIVGGNEESSGTASYMAIHTRNSAGDIAERMRIDSTGKVGIGNTDPYATLEVNTKTIDGSIRIGNWEDVDQTNRYGKGTSIEFIADGDPHLAETNSPLITASVKALYDKLDDDTDTVKNSNTALSFSTLFGDINSSPDFSEKMRISSNGTVLIGNSSSISNSNLLEVKGSQYNYLTNQGITILPADGNSSQQIYTNYSSGGSEQSLALGTFSNRSNQLFLRTNGCVGIGTASPGAILNIGVPSTANIGTLYTSLRDCDDPDNSVDLQYQYKYKADGSFTSGSRIRFAKDSTVVDEYGSDIRFLTRQHGYAPSEKMRITGDGKVGIGTLTPSTKLDVNGVVNAAEGIILGNNTGTVDGTLRFNNGVFEGYTGTSWNSLEGNVCHISESAPASASVGDFWWDSGNGDLNIYYSDVDSSQWVSINSSQETESSSTWLQSGVNAYYTDGNVGVGTVSPDSLFEVEKNNNILFDVTDDSGQRDGTATIQISNQDGTVGSFSQLLFDTAGTGQSIARIAAVRVGNGSNDLAFALEHGDTKHEAMRIKSTGKVGIGTSDPDGNLHTYSSSNSTINIIKASNHLGVSAALIAYQNSHAEVRVGTNHPLLFKTNDNNERMRISGSSANVGIGGIDPLARLHVKNDQASTVQATLKLEAPDPMVMFKDSTNTGNYYMRWQSGIGTAQGFRLWHDGNDVDGSGTNSGNPDFMIDLNGNVGIGTTSPSKKLHVNGGSLRVDIGTTPDSAAIFAGGGSNLHIDLNSGYSTFRNTAGDTDASGFHFKSINNDLVTIRNDGNVGVGEGSPEARLHVKKTDVATKYVDAYSTMVIEDTEARLQLCASNAGTNAAAITLSNGANHWTMHHRGPSTTGYLAFGHVNTTTTSDIVQAAMSTTATLSLHTDGNVGIGTVDPEAPLEVRRNIDSPNLLLRSLSNTDPTLSFLSDSKQFTIGIDDTNNSLVFSEGSALGSSDRMTIDSSGNVGIGTTSPYSKLHVTGGGITSAHGFATKTAKNLFIAQPEGAYLEIEANDPLIESGTNGQVIGAIKVQLPQSWTNTMMTMQIRVYDYSMDESFDIFCGGYNFAGNGGGWYNTFAYVLSSPFEWRNFPVRFTHDGSKCCIFIGDTNQTWNFPRANVINFTAGYSGDSVSNYGSGWDMSIETTIPTHNSYDKEHLITRHSPWVVDKTTGNIYNNWTGNRNFGVGISNPAEKLEVDGAVKLGTTSNNNVGTIRYNTTTNDFEGNTDGTSGGWASLTAGGSTSTPSVSTIFFNNETTTSGAPSTDGALFRYDNNFFGEHQDTLVIEKTDLNGNNPDGGIAFTNRGADGLVETAMAIRGYGSVGIGTPVPQERLDVYGNIKLGSHTNDGVIRAWTSRGTDEGGNSTNGSNLILKAGIGTGSGTNGQIEFHTEHITTVIDNGAPHGSGSAKMVVDSDGKVGIGTTSPGSKLQIGTSNSNQYYGGDVNISNSILSIYNNPSEEVERSHATMQFSINGGTHNRVGGISLVAQSEDTRKADLSFWPDGGPLGDRFERMRITGDGSIKIGGGTVLAPDCVIIGAESSTGSSNQCGNWTYTNSANDQFAIQPRNSILIGDSNFNVGRYAYALGGYNEPTAQHSISIGHFNKSLGWGSICIGFWNESGGELTSNPHPQVDFDYHGDYAISMGYKMYTRGENSFGISLNQPSTPHELTQDNTMAIMGGNVGIGTTSPGSTLDVNGNVTLSGVTEKFQTHTSAGNTVSVDLNTNHYKLHHVSGLSGNFTVDIDNIGLSDGEATNISLMVQQESTAYTPSTLNIDSFSNVTINWQGGSAPSGTAGGIDIFSFTILNTVGNNGYTVLGNMVSFS